MLEGRGKMHSLALGSAVVALFASSADAFSASPMPLRCAGSTNLASVQKLGRARPAVSQLQMGFFDGITKAFEDSMSVPPSGGQLDGYSGWIERDGMRQFTFDGKEAMSAPVAGSYTLAGRPAGAKPPPKADSGPFAFFSPTPPKTAVPAKVNQDGVLCVPEVYDGVGMYCVFDGHGEFGEKVTEWTTANLPAYIAQAVSEGRPGELLNRITDAYRNADQALTEALTYEIIEDSGTTAALTLIKGDLLLVGGLGDSRVVLALDNQDGTLSAQALTLDQSPVVAVEKQRVEKAGGEVRNEGQSGRIYAKGQMYPGLAVSRAFGDGDAKKYGVTTDPQFIGWKLRPQTDFAVILASDGVWNALDNEVASVIVGKYRANKDANGAAKELVASARQVWESVAQGRIDDISAVVLFL